MSIIMENSIKKEVINGDTQNKKVKDDCGVNDFTPE